MRLSLSVNGRQIAKAGLRVKGWLSAHVTLSHDIESDEPPNSVWLNAADISEDPNTIHSDWDAVPLSVGDRVEIEILPDGESDSPKSIRRTSDSPRNLFSDVEQARSLLAAIKTCDGALMGVLDRAKHTEPPEEFQKIALAIGGIIAELDRQLISPTLRRHPTLLAEAEELKIR
jgi:hypothetical protein